MMRRFLLFLLTAVVACAAHAAEFQVAVFRADITIPLGHACMGGGVAPAAEIVDPLYVHGVALLGPELPLLFVAVDWCEIRNDAYEHWRNALAECAHTTPDRVLLASVHQHDAPVVDYEAQRLLDEVGLDKALCDVAFARACVDRAAAALKDALRTPRPVTHYGISMARVEGVASNRRVALPDGAVHYGRGSATKDPALRNLPEGIIDPWLKTLSFWDGETPVAAISAYATHPMSYYGKGGVSADFVGMARARRQAEAPELFQMYFTGCSGDTTAGKFNDGDPANRSVLADRLYQGMMRAWQTTRRHPLEQVDFRVTDLVLAPKDFGGYGEADARAMLENPNEKVFTRNLAAMALSWRKRATEKPIHVPLVDFGQAGLLVLPAESFVGYQLIAQGLRPDTPLVVAGFGECAPGYVPTAIASSEGYNDESWCWVAPGAEPVITGALQRVLNP